jgi:hypothetical protein
MTKTGLGIGSLLVAALLALSAPPASAHGAAAAREIDTRVLLDHDGALGYGGCLDGSCLPGTGLDSGALDLLALDVRELRDANGTALLAFRTTAQSEAAQVAGRSIAISFTLGGQAKALTLQGDGLAYTSADVDQAFVSKDPIGDGHAKAVEAWVSLARLGAKPGDTLTNIQVASGVGTTKGDIVPGTWFPANEQDQAVPFVPDGAPSGPGDLAAPAAGTYTVAGPARLVELSVDNAKPDTSHAPAKVVVTLHNPLKQLPQFVTLHAAGPGLAVGSDAMAVNLDAGTSKAIALTVTGPASTLNLTATSDLGGYASLLLPVANQHATAPPPGPGSASGASSAPAPRTTSSAATAPPASSASTTKKSPAAAPALLLVGLAAVAAARRPRGR